MRLTRSVLVGAVSVACVLTLSSCGPGAEKTAVNFAQRDPTVSSMTVAEAKSQAQLIEDDVAARVDVDAVVRTQRIDPGTLLGCSRGAYQWSGGSSVSLATDASARDIVGTLAKSYAGEAEDQGLVYEKRKGRGDSHDFVLRGDHGASYYVSADQTDSTVEITSFSSCFELEVLPDGGLSY